MEIIAQILKYGQVIIDVLGALVLVSTLIVRVTPSTTDDESVGKVYGLWLKAIQFLPTLGVNPQTKKLEDIINELKK